MESKFIWSFKWPENGQKSNPASYTRRVRFFLRNMDYADKPRMRQQRDTDVIGWWLQKMNVIGWWPYTVHCAEKKVYSWRVVLFYFWQRACRLTVSFHPFFVFRFFFVSSLQFCFCFSLHFFRFIASVLFFFRFSFFVFFTLVFSFFRFVFSF